PRAMCPDHDSHLWVRDLRIGGVSGLVRDELTLRGTAPPAFALIRFRSRQDCLRTDQDTWMEVGRLFELQRLLWDIRKDVELATRFHEEPDAVLDSYGIEGTEREAMRTLDFKTL